MLNTSKRSRTYSSRSHCSQSPSQMATNATYIVRYTVALPGASEREELEGCLEVPRLGEPGDKLTLAAVRGAWPYEGAWHFRAQASTKEGHVYLDLPSDGAVVPLNAADGTATIRALPLFNVTTAEEEGAVEPPFASPDAYYAAVKRRREAAGLEPWDPIRFPVSYSVDDGRDAGRGGGTPPPRQSPAPLPASRDSAAAAAAAVEEDGGGGGGSFWESGAGGAEEYSDDHNGGNGGDQRFATSGGGEGGDSAFGPGDGEAEVDTDSDLRGVPPPRSGGGGGGFKGFFASAQRAVEKAAERAINAVDKAAAAAERAVEGTTAGGGGGGAQKSGGGGGGGWFGHLAKGAKSLIGGGGPAAAPAPVGEPASEEALVNLQSLHVQYQTPFRPEFGPHEALLEELWGAAVHAGAVEGEFVRVGPQWEEVRRELVLGVWKCERERCGCPLFCSSLSSFTTFSWAFNRMILLRTCVRAVC